MGCRSAKTVLDPRAVNAVKVETYEKAPKGCSRYQGGWFFNDAQTGAPEKESAPVCKASVTTTTTTKPAATKPADGNTNPAAPKPGDGSRTKPAAGSPTEPA